MRIRDPGIVLTLDPGSGINIPDPQYWSGPERLADLPGLLRTVRYRTVPAGSRGRSEL
jgi:hypothetical protein